MGGEKGPTRLVDPEVHLARLGNGVAVVIMPLPWARTVGITIWIDAGTKDEKPEENGIAHFLEHITFKGTKRRTAGQIARTIDALGGFCDAFTDKEATCFYAQVLPDQMIKATQLLWELISEPALREEDIEKERQIIISEIQSVRDSPEDVAADLFYQALWDGHPLSRPVLGTEETTQAISRYALATFHGANYTGQRIIVTAAGAVEPALFMETVDRFFGSLSTGEARKGSALAPGFTGRIRAEHRETSHLYFCIGVPGLSACDPASHVVALLDAIVGGGASSRLFLSIRERRGLAYSIYSGAGFFRDGGHFWIGGSCAPSRAEKVVRIVRQELTRLCHNGLKAGEMEAAKVQLKMNAITVQENALGSAIGLAKQIYYLGRPIPLSLLLARLDRIQDEEAVEVARELFLRPVFSIALVGPMEEKDGMRLLDILNDH